MNQERIGLFEDLSNEDYHSGPGISKSHLDVVAKSPLHYWDKYVNDNREPEEPTDSMILGTATHTAILEPDLFPSLYVVVPGDAPKRPTSVQRKAKNPSAETLLAIDWWDDFNQANAGKTILDAEDYKTCLAMRDAVHIHSSAGRLLQGGRSEQSFYCIEEETGELIKCRPDYLRGDGGMVDVKTTEDASPAGFAKSVVNYRYYVQAPWYTDIPLRLYGEIVPYFVFVAVEKKRPYAVATYFVENEQLDVGRERYMKDLRLIAECKQAGNWPGYSQEIEPLKLPRWFNPLD